MKTRVKERVKRIGVIAVIWAMFISMIPSIAFADTAEENKKSAKVVEEESDIAQVPLEALKLTDSTEGKAAYQSKITGRSANTINAHIRYLNTNIYNPIDEVSAGKFSVTYNGKTYVGYCRNPGMPSLAPGTYTFTYWGEKNGKSWYYFGWKWVNSKYEIDSADWGNIGANPIFPIQVQGVIFGIPKPQKGKLYIKKTAANNEYDIDKHTVSGALYGVYGSKGNAKVDYNRYVTLKTKADGSTDWAVLDNEGYYYVKEVKPPEGFQLDPKIHEVYIKSGEKRAVKSKDYIKPGRLKLRKVILGDEPLVKLCPENYSIKGAVYGIYGNSKNAKADKGRINTLVTKEDGSTSTLIFDKPGIYYVKEIKAPKGYKLDRTDYGYGNNGVKQVVVHADKTTYITMKDEPQFDPMAFVLKKVPEKGGDKSLSTAGAKYSVKYYKTFLYNEEDVKKAGKPFRTWTFKTKEGFDKAYSYFEYGDEYKVDGPKLFKDSKGKYRGLIGTYVFEETEAPKGFVKTDGIVAIRRFNPEKNEHVGAVNEEAEPLEINTEEPEQKATIRIHKKDKETGENKAQSKYGGTLKGAKYNVFYFDPLDMVDILVGTITTDENGEGIMENLKLGWYKVKEVLSSDGYLLDEEKHEIKARAEELNTPVFYYDVNSYETPIGINVDKVGLGENGVKHPVKGAVLALYKADGKELDRWTTDGNIKTLKALPVGDYYIKEIKAPEGYLPLEEIYTFTVDRDGYAKKTNENVSVDPSKEVVKVKKGTTKVEISNERKPEVKTEAKFSSNVKSSLPLKDLKVVDTITYKNVLKGYPYTFKGKLICKETGKTVAEGKKTFTPMEVSGTTKVEYSFNGTEYEGKTLVATEKLYRDNRIGNKLVAEHSDLEDNKQTVTISTGKTEAKDKVDDGKDLFAGKKQTIVDTVSYEKLIAGKEYTLTGTLMVRSTNLPLTDKNGKTVTASKTFVPKGKPGTVVNGSEKIEFTFDASLLKGETLVAFEKVSEDGIDVFVHEDIEDKDQSIYIPKISTTATSQIDGSKLVLPVRDISIVDRVEYENLIVDQNYLIKGELVRKSDSKVLNRTEACFKATETEGNLTLDFIADMTELAGEDVVVFETLVKLDDEGNELKIVAEHRDLEDKDQTVHVEKPEIGTKATWNDGTKKTSILDKMVIKDIISYKNLVVDKEYTVKGKLMDRLTGKPLLIDGKEVTAEKTFTATDKNGSIEMDFNFSGKKLKKKTDIVVFEKIFYEDQEILAHVDMNDLNQTVTASPSVKTGDDSNLYIHIILLILAIQYILIIRSKKYSI